VVIDLHSGDVFETLVSHAGRYLTDNGRFDQLTAAMVESFGTPYGISWPFPVRPGGLAANAVLRGKLAMFVEVGGNALVTDDDIFTVYQGLINALRALDVLEGMRPPAQLQWLAPGTRLTAPTSGLWRPAVTPRQSVRAGDLLGTLTDLLGDELARLSADQPGIVLYYLSALAAREGDTLVCLAREE
jgi:predicted deacylase